MLCGYSYSYLYFNLTHKHSLWSTSSFTKMRERKPKVMWKYVIPETRCCADATHCNVWVIIDQMSHLKYQTALGDSKTTEAALPLTRTWTVSSVGETGDKNERLDWMVGREIKYILVRTEKGRRLWDCWSNQITQKGIWLHLEEIQVKHQRALKRKMWEN